MLPWWFRWWRICLQCRRLGFDPWVGKILRRSEWLTHCSILAWRIPRTEEPGRLQSMRSQRVRHNWAILLEQSFMITSSVGQGPHLWISGLFLFLAASCSLPLFRYLVKRSCNVIPEDPKWCSVGNQRKICQAVKGRPNIQIPLHGWNCSHRYVNELAKSI